jgi:hypothetical protein
MMDIKTRIRVRRALKNAGFDLTTSSKDGSVRPKCSRCQVLVINQVACHETGCPNMRRKKK